MKTERKIIHLSGVLLLLLLLLAGIAMIPSAAFAKAKAVKIEGSKSVAKGKKVTLKANQKVTWKSSNKKVATVSSKGVVKGVKPGKVTITAVSKAKKSLKKKWKMTVRKKAVKSVKISAPTKELILADKKTVTLKATITPSGAAKSVTWKSSNTKVAKVDKKGKVTAVGVGEAKITATAADGSKKKASVTITVKKMKPITKVGISMPTAASRRWQGDGQKLEEQLKENGFEAELYFADNDKAVQNEQLQNMIAGGCQALVVAPIDSAALESTLQIAKKKKIPVLSFDRLLWDTDAVSYYVTFSNYDIGKLQGNYIKDKLNLDKAAGPFNLEISAGDPGDGVAGVFYNGAMSVLQPYIDSGKLKVLSKQVDYSHAATPGWETDKAQERAAKIISNYYSSGARIDAWLCPNDSTALGVTNALVGSGYKGKWPIITGQDCDYENVRNILHGRQSMSVYKDTDDLVDLTVSAIKSMSKGEDPAVNTRETNGKIMVPTHYADLSIITAENVSKLVEDGRYTSDFLK